MEIKKKGLILVIIVLIFLIFIRYVNYNHLQKRIDNLKLMTEKTTGKVVDYEYYSSVGGGNHGHTYYYHIMTIEYVVDDETYTETHKYRGPGKKICNLNDSVYILYNPNKIDEFIPETIKEYQIKTLKDYKKIIIFQMIITVVLIGVYYYKNQYEIKY